MDRILSLRGKCFKSSLLSPEDAYNVVYENRGRRMSECRTSSTRSPKRLMEKKDMKKLSGRHLSFDVAQHARKVSYHGRTGSLEGKDVGRDLIPNPSPFRKIQKLRTVRKQASLDTYFSARNRRFAIDSSI
eukprot:TRINITY_DN33117_c0_g1_i1.p1 TRINITY_DN33117_c0_g1~~TRINITY_DN33117_c0_g1_i1.p1  ORF type:complete len:131 (-),score=31.07 TRINITY_DN33117_c0_g1_i1:164-556(-)